MNKKIFYLFLLMFVFGCFYKNDNPELIVELGNEYTSDKEKSVRVFVDPQGSFEVNGEVSHFSDLTKEKISINNGIGVLNLVDGINILNFEAINGFGSKLSKTVNLIYDGTNPEILVETDLSKSYLSDEIDLVFEVNEDNLSGVEVNNEPILPVNNKYIVKVKLEEIENNLQIRAIDKAENATLNNYTVRIRNEAPFIQVYTDLAEVYKKVMVRLDLAIIDDDLKEVKINNKIIKVIDGKAEIEVSLDQSMNDFEIIAIDIAGNTTKRLVNLKKETEFNFVIDNLNSIRDKINFDRYKITGKVANDVEIKYIDNNGNEKKVDNIIKTEDNKFEFFVDEGIKSIIAINDEKKSINVSLNSLVNKSAKLYLENKESEQNYRVTTDDEVEFKIMARNLDRINLVNFDLKYDKNLLEIKEINGQAIVFEDENNINVFNNDSNNKKILFPGTLVEEGNLQGNLLCLIGKNYILGDGMLGVVKFTKKAAGETSVYLDNVRFVDDEGNNNLISGNGYGEIIVK